MTHTHTTPCTTTTTTTLYIALHDTTLMPLHYTTRLHYSTQQYSTQYATWQRSTLITPHRNYNCNGSEGRNGPPGNGLYCLTLLLAVFSKLRNARLENLPAAKPRNVQLSRCEKSGFATFKQHDSHATLVTFMSFFEKDFASSLLLVRRPFSGMPALLCPACVAI